MSKTKCLIHIVFATKRREMAIPEATKRDLYHYILGIIRNKQCYLHRLGGIGNHIHMLIDLNPTVALADFVKTVKRQSSIWMKGDERFPGFDSWGEGYYAVSVGVEGLEACKRYIANQEVHHGVVEFMNEMEDMATQNGLRWYGDDWK
ncbi:MAG: IS200/IS605 family transposase [Paramuribaculum sp.]|nr:IS200/IS605 family transposase [Paramuribaculum sp.]